MIIDSDLPNTESKLVLNATFSTFTPPYLSPFKVELFSSLPILDTTTLKPITDATMLWIENESVIDTLKYNNLVGAYTTNEFYFPKIDKNYSIKVTKEGFHQIFASSYIPSKVSLSDVKLVTLAGIDKEGLAYSSVTLSFLDPSNETNFYEIIITEVSNEANKYRLWTNDKIITNEPYYPSILSLDKKMPKRLLFNDSNIKNYNEVTIFFTPEQEINKGKHIIRYGIVDVYLRSVTKEYYKYQTTSLQHNNNQKGDFLYGLGEPLNVFSNIVGGYGIFAGFQNEAITCVVDTITVK